MIMKTEVFFVPVIKTEKVGSIISFVRIISVDIKYCRTSKIINWIYVVLTNMISKYITIEQDLASHVRMKVCVIEVMTIIQPTITTKIYYLLNRIYVYKDIVLPKLVADRYIYDIGVVKTNKKKD